MEFLTITGVVLFVAFFFGFCIFIHELGHFLAAKWRGLHIIAFSIGFKKIWSKKWNGVEYRLGWIPFGGYVDLPQIDSTGIPKDENGKELPKAKPLDKMIAAFAGPLFNVIFGFALACVIWTCGVPQDTPKMRSIVVGYIQENAPEYAAGLREGDRIVKVNGHKFYKTWGEFARDTIFAVGNIVLTVERDGNFFDVSYILKENPEVMANEKIGYPFFRPRIPVKIYPMPGSLAEKAGLKNDDEIIAMNGKNILNHEDFSSFFSSDVEPGPLNITVIRNGVKQIIENVKPVPIENDKGSYKMGAAFENTIPLVVSNVLDGSGAAQAGIQKGDTFIVINGKNIDEFKSLHDVVVKSNGEPVKVKILRAGKELEFVITPKLYKHYDIGVQFVTLNYPNPWEQFISVIDMSAKTLRGIFSKESTIKTSHLSGPIGILRAIGISVYYGSFMHGINIIVMITFSLGLINLLPIPVLDGGHITIAALEGIFRRPLPPFIIQSVTYVFVVLLISFMLFVTFFDLRRVYTGFAGDTKKPTVSAKPSVPKSLSAEQQKAEKNDNPQENKKN